MLTLAKHRVGTLLHSPPDPHFAETKQMKRKKEKKRSAIGIRKVVSLPHRARARIRDAEGQDTREIGEEICILVIR